jgi:hypothetical protein
MCVNWCSFFCSSVQAQGQILPLLRFVSVRLLLGQVAPRRLLLLWPLLWVFNLCLIKCPTIFKLGTCISRTLCVWHSPYNCHYKYQFSKGQFRLLKTYHNATIPNNFFKISIFLLAAFAKCMPTLTLCIFVALCKCLHIKAKSNWV